MNLPHVETLLQSLERVRETGTNKWQACCPGHEDRQASLSIGIGREENILLKCFAGCDLDTILRRLGKTAADLYMPKTDTRNAPSPSYRAEVPTPAPMRPAPPKTQEKTAVKTAEKTARARLVVTYNYTEEAGGLLYQVCRYDPKDFRQRRPNGAGGWTYNLKDTRRVLYRLPDVLRAVGAGETVFLPEGEKDCETLRAWGLTATTNAMGAEAPWLAEYSETLRGANVVILPDNDAPGRKCCDRRGAALIAVAAEVRVLPLPGLTDKGDVSDWAAMGGAKEELLRLAASAPRWKEAEPTQTAAEEEEASDDYALPYQETPSGLVWLRVTRDGKARTPLTNFTARILADILEDDGAETSLRYRIQAKRNDKRGEKTVTFTIPAASFDGFGWVAEHLGIGAACYPGALMKEHAGFAIRQLSEASGATRETTFTHTGWRALPSGCWGYLHAGGVIGADAESGLSVRLADAWAGYALPLPPTGETLQQAVRASLNMTLLASPALTFPLLAAVYRAAVGSADFSLSLSGPSGAFKSELASLAQRHYGAGMNASNLPGSWSSTENALEELAFRVKDALLVIDDFAPTGGANDIARLHAKADRVLRAQGNGSGRQRMRRDGSLHAARPPRGLILSTGEDIPQGKSLRARQFILEVGPNDVDANRLTASQKDAGNGLYAQCMAGFLAWYAPRYEIARESYCADVERLRAQAYAEGGKDAHRRTPEIVADLWQGLSCFLQFAHAAGALTETEKWDWYERGKKAILQAAQTQAVHQQASDPATRFLDLIRSALSSGAAHVADMDGTRPDAANAWGWRQTLVGTGQYEAVRWEPKGERIGWTDGDSLYLEKDAAFKVARSQSGDSDGVPLTQTVLYKRLLEGGHLSSTEKSSARGTLHIRKRAEKKLQNVLHLPAVAILRGKSDISDISDMEPDSE